MAGVINPSSARQPAEPRPCAVCGQPALLPVEHAITAKKRVKFGFLMVLLSILTLGGAVLIWLVLPRRTVAIGIDRYLQCDACGARQP